MALEIRTFAGFYDSHRGLIARRLIARRLRALWPDLTGQRLLGFGYATPYLRPYLGQAERVVAAVPAAEGLLRWAPAGRGLAAVVEDPTLPFPDLFFDRVLLVHGLELTESKRPFMRDLWRILAPEGRLVVVTPNRTGLWAQFETSPFGQGQPYTRTQLGTLLEQALFQVERWDMALCMPPFGRRSFRTAAAWERLGRRLWPRLAGVHIVEATKSLYAVTPAAPARARLIPALAGARRA